MDMVNMSELDIAYLVLAMRFVLHVTVVRVFFSLGRVSRCQQGRRYQ